ncbi:MAG: hypothetical protein ACF8PN_13050 [Phycisphaerales bacterium]
MIGSVVLAGVIGTLALAVGLVGRRINDHPICRRCRYDLVGVNESSVGRCPECGADLSAPKAIRVGARRRRIWPLSIGAGLLAVAIACGVAWSVAGARGFDWNTVKPDWWLVFDLNSGVDATRNAAITHLFDRLGEDRLSERTIQRVVARGLEAQADLSRTWPVEWGDLIEVLQMTERLRPADFERYTRQLYAPQTIIRSVVPTGSWVGAELRVGPSRGGSGARPHLSAGGEFVQASVNGVILESRHVPSMVRWTEDSRFPRSIFIDLPRGHHRVETVWNFSVNDRTAMHKAVERREEVPEPISLFTESVTVEHVIEVVDAGFNPVELVTSDRTIDALGTPVGVHSVTVRVPQTRENAAWFSVSVTKAQMPLMALSFDVFWRVDDHEWKIGSLFIREEESSGQYHGVFEGLPVETGQVDVILRPNAALALAESPDTDEIWGVEVILSDVPIAAGGSWTNRRIRP